MRTLATAVLLLAASGCATCGDGGDGTGGGAGGGGGGRGGGGGSGVTYSLDLSVTAVSPATGAVRWRRGAASASCAASCRYPFAAGATVQLTAEPSALAGVQRWAGDCADAGFTLTCTLAMTANRAVAVTLTPWNVVFASSVAVAPRALGGLDGADALCRSLAADAGFSGAFVAALSTASSPLASRIPPTARGWARPDGRPFADTADGLFRRGQVFYPPRLNELGADLYRFDDDVVVVTGSDVSGQPAVEQCSGFTDGGAGEVVTSGFAAAGAGTWIEEATWPCSQPARIYCLGTSFSAPIAPVPDPANRLAFLSREPFIPDAGIDGGDAQCQRDAADAGLGGTFIALLASGTLVGPGARFSTTGPPWQMPDGVVLAPTAADFFSPQFDYRWAGVTMFADGTYTRRNYAYWTGSSTPISLPVATCGDWTSAAGGDVGISMQDAALSGGFYLRGRSTPCSAADRHLVCFQQ